MSSKPPSPSRPTGAKRSRSSSPKTRACPVGGRRPAPSLRGRRARRRGPRRPGGAHAGRAARRAHRGDRERGRGATAAAARPARERGPRAPRRRVHRDVGAGRGKDGVSRRGARVRRWASSEISPRPSCSSAETTGPSFSRIRRRTSSCPEARFRERLSGAEWEPLRAALEEAAVRPSPYETRAAIPGPSGERFFRIAIVTLPGEERGPRVILLLEDLTDFLRADRLAAWVEAARSIAHDIKNPLTPIRLAAERLGRFEARRETPPPGTFCRGGVRDPPTGRNPDAPHRTPRPIRRPGRRRTAHPRPRRGRCPPRRGRRRLSRPRDRRDRGRDRFGPSGIRRGSVPRARRSDELHRQLGGGDRRLSGPRASLGGECDARVRRAGGPLRLRR